ncbi:hypothetical protein ACLK19_22665 [Escherichia coli]
MLDKGMWPGNSSIRHALRRLTLASRAEIAFSAPYLSEMVRRRCITVMAKVPMKTVIAFTPPSPAKSSATQQAVRDDVLDYGMRHGYRGPANLLWKVGESAWDNNKITGTLKALPTSGPLLPPPSPAPILGKRRRCWRTVNRRIGLEGVRWARPYRSDTRQGPTPRKVTDVPQTGQQISVRRLAMHGG